MGDWLEVIIISSVGILAVLFAKKIFKKSFHVLWRKFIWFLIMIRMLVIYNPAFFWGKGIVLPVIPMSGYNDLLIMGVIPQGAVDEGLRIGILYEVPLVDLLLAGIMFVSIIRIMAHHEEYGFAVNKLLEHIKIADEGVVFRLFEETKNELGIGKKITLYISEKIHSPMIIGYVHVGVVIPIKLINRYEAGEINKEYLRYVFLHELTHFQKKDILYKRGLLLVSDLYWFNPLVYIMQKEAVEDLECCCDGYVTRQFLQEEKQKYCKILLDFMDGGKENKFRLDMSARAKKVKERIDNIMDTTFQRKGLTVVVGILLAMFLAGGIQIEKNPDYPHGLIHFSNQLMNEVMQACEIKVQDSLYLETDIYYENSLKRDVWTVEELQEAIHIYVRINELDKFSEEERERIKVIINSYFGVTMNVTFE